MKYNIFTLYILAFLMLGCGADTDPSTPTIISTPTILETRLVHIQEAKNPKQLDIKFEVIFSTAPMNLKVEDNIVGGKIADWEQHDNIVSLYIRTDKFVCTRHSPEGILCSPEDVQIIKENLERTFRCTLVWNTGRQNLELKVTIPIELAVYTP